LAYSTRESLQPQPAPRCFDSGIEAAQQAGLDVANFAAEDNAANTGFPNFSIYTSIIETSSGVMSVAVYDFAPQQG
jgi:hypothetical protein